jgi:hypothetical protein
MSLYDFFFPEQAQATHLRTLANQSRRGSTRKRPVDSKTSSRLADLEKDVGFVALLLAAMLDRLDEKGVVTRSDLREAVAELDEIDGVRDGRLDVSTLRGMQS